MVCCWITGEDGAAWGEVDLLSRTKTNVKLATAMRTISKASLRLRMAMITDD
jgi:hypothetical protein